MRGRLSLASGSRPLSAVELAKRGATCPLRARSVPAGWAYNASLWAPLIDEYLAPWAEGGITATVLDMAFWRTIYGEGRLHDLAFPASVARTVGTGSGGGALHAQRGAGAAVARGAQGEDAALVT